MLKRTFSFLLLLCSAAAFAQAPAKDAAAPREPKTPEQRATALADRLEKDLALSADQKTKVHALALTKAQKMDQLREQNKGKEKTTWADARKQVRDEFTAGMKSVLTPEQFAKWEAQKKEHRRHAKPKSPEERAAGFANHLEKQLGLSATQKTEVQRLALEKDKKLLELREKNKGKEKSEWENERKQVTRDFISGMKTALTAEQFAKWEAMKKERHDNKKEPEKKK